MSEIFNSVLASVIVFVIYYVLISLALMILRSIFCCCEDKSEKRGR
jgi:hypothetical protein